MKNTSLFISYLLVSYVLAMVTLNGIYADGFWKILWDPSFAFLRTNFWMLMLTLFLLVEVITEVLTQGRWASRKPWQRWLGQVAFGIVGAGMVMYALTLAYWHILGNAALQIDYPQYIIGFEFTALALANVYSLFRRYGQQFIKTGACPQEIYLDTLLLRCGDKTVKVPVDDLAYIYVKPHSKERWAQLRNGTTTYWEAENTIEYLAEHLDPEEFFNGGRGLIVHWSAIQKTRRSGRELKIWLNPPLLERDGREDPTELQVYLPRRLVKELKDWQNHCLTPEKASRSHT